MTLAQKNCQACDGSLPALSLDEAQKYLTQLKNWQILPDGKWLFKEFLFKNFAQSLAFVNKVGAVAEAQNHHPNIDFTWGVAKILIQTHKINGLVESDFILAAKIDEIC